LAVDSMKLGATDFVRKPLTPETLRNSVAAALAKKTERAVVAAASGTAQPEIAAPAIIETITLNGFEIVDADDEVPSEPDQRRFVVIGPDGNRQEVLVQIDEDPIGYVERLTRRRLPPENSFWTQEARNLLSDYLWTEGKTPPDGKLIIKDLDPDKLPIAERWSDV